LKGKRKGGRRKPTCNPCEWRNNVKEYINLLEKHSANILWRHQKIMGKLEKARSFAVKRGDARIAGVLETLKVEVDRSGVETALLCGLVKALREQLERNVQGRRKL